MTAGPLSRLRIVDLTHYLAGPYCTKLMAGFGAEVIKVERPGLGDKMRSVGPFYENQAGLERSISFQWLNTGKKSITLNLKSEKGKEILKRLIQGADLLIENFAPRVMPGLGLGFEELQRVNSNLVMTSISNFGQSGPYRDYKASEAVEYALSGAMYLTGDANREPLASGPSVCQYTAGVYACIASLAAIFQRNSMRTGQQIDISIHESATASMEITLANYLQGAKTMPTRNNDRHPLVPWELYECKDGQVAVIGGPVRRWLKGARLFGDPRLLEKKFFHAADRIEKREEFEVILKSRTKEFQKKELFTVGQESGLAFGYLASFEEVLDSPQHKARKYFEEIRHPVLGKHKYCGPPFKMSETPWKAKRAPLLGEHNKMVYEGILKYSRKEIGVLNSQGVI